MKLYYSETSPFARKTRIVALERGWNDRIDWIVASPFEGETNGLAAANPLSKIPTLALDDGTVLFDSKVICEYLDAAAPGARLLPAEGPARWKTLTTIALTDGVMEAAFATVMELRRPEAERSQTWIDRWNAAMTRGLAALEPLTTGAFDLGQVGMACAVGYLHFRLPEVAAAAPPAVTAWWDAIKVRPSVAATHPPV